MNFRRFSVFLVCISGGILLMMLLTKKDQTQQPNGPTGATTATATATTGPASTGSATSAGAAGNEKPLPFAENDTLNFRFGSLDKNSGYKFQIDLVNEGAGIVDIQLSEYYATAKDKRLADKLNNERAYQEKVAASQGEYLGHFIAQAPLGEGFQKEQTAAGLAKNLSEIKKQLQDMEARSKELEKQNQPKPPGFFQNDQVHLPLATRKISLTSMEIADDKGVKGAPSWPLYNARWILLSRNETKESQSISFYWALTQGGKEIFRLVKTYTIKVNDYSIYVSLEAVNSTGREMTIALDQAGPTDLLREDVRSDERRIALGRQQEKVNVVMYNLFDGSAGPKSVKSLAKNASDEELPDIEKTLLSGTAGQKLELRKYFPDGLPEPVLVNGQAVYKADGSWWKSLTGSKSQIWAQFYPPLGRSAGPNAVLWMGQTDKFFASLMYLQPEGKNSPPPTQYRAFELGDSKNYRTQADIESITIAAGRSSQVQFNLFTGPKDGEKFKTVPYNELDKLNYDGAIDTGSCCAGITFFGLLPWLTAGLMWLLEHLGLWVGNYGVAIIILVIIIRVLLHPLTKKGQISMMKMQKFAPQMQALKEKYKDDKDALQRETMKFYKEKGATPILGCLPMFLQMPIWIALYTAFNADVNLRQAAFLPVWITDLAGQDAIVSWPSHAFSIPLMGPIVSFNLLPILLTVAMYYQTKLTPTSMTTPSTPQQAQQQKMMKWMTPIMMLVFFYNAPAGLNLYIMTSTFSSVFEQMIIRKHIKEKEAAEAAAETMIEIPGKAARGSRPKKAKGPFWTKRG